MKNRLWFMTCGKLLLFIPSAWAHPSLFFTEKELQAIHQNLLPQTRFEENLYLAALIYVDKTHWTIWLNDQVIRPSDPQSLREFHIERVTTSLVEFSWRSPQSTLPIKFTLRPHQIYLPKENRVVAK